MTVLLKNNVEGFLISAITNSDVSLTLTPGGGAIFPSPASGQYFYATLSSTNGTTEIVKCTSRSGDVLTVVRAQEGTTASAFPAASKVEMRVTVASVVDAINDQIAQQLINIKAFGAVGDGVTDDTAAINSALVYAKSIGGVVVIPAGTFVVSGTITVQNGVRGMKGLGGVIKFTAPGSRILLDGLGPAQNVFDFTMSELTIDANNQVGIGSGGAVACVLAENPSHCSFINNTIYQVRFDTGRGGIYLRSLKANAADTIFNVVSGNVITGTAATLGSEGNAGISLDILDSDFNLTSGITTYANPSAYWKGTFTAATATYKNKWNVVSNNVVNGAYYGISLVAADFNEISGNVLRTNVRNISIQHSCLNNNVVGNVCNDSISASIHIAYGGQNNVVSGNTVTSDRASVEALLNCYVGCSNNTFTGNRVTTTGGSAPKQLMYCAIKSSNNEFSNNVLTGSVARCYIGVESAWNTTTTNPASYAYLEGAGVDNFTNAGMSNITIRGNVINATSPLPAIFLYQVSDGSGNYALTNCTIEGNVVTNSTPSYQLEMAEWTSGQSNNHILKNNSFFPTEDGPGYYSWARGRAHFVMVSGNTPINYPSSSYVYPDAGATPNVAYNDYVSLAGYGTPTTVTNFTGANDGQIITVRLSTAVTIQNNANIILKGGTDITSVDANKFVQLFKRDSTTWVELTRNF